MIGVPEHCGRFSAEPGHEVVVFLIGMRFNKLWKIHKWWPVVTAMPTMLRCLGEHPELGCLGWHASFGRTTVMIQYWRSFEDLERFAQDGSLPHLEAWRRFNGAVRDGGDVGIWHETYRVARGQYETLYSNMPVFGLARATRQVPTRVAGQSAASRLGTNKVRRIAPY